MASELILLAKTYKLLNMSYPVLKNYPNCEKYALCADIKHNFFEFMKDVNIANKVNSLRMKKLQEADGVLQTLKVLFNVSHEQKYISKGFHFEASNRLDEINKLLVGFMRYKPTKVVDEIVSKDMDINKSC